MSGTPGIFDHSCHGISSRIYPENQYSNETTQRPTTDDTVNNGESYSRVASVASNPSGFTISNGLKYPYHPYRIYSHAPSSSGCSSAYAHQGSPPNAYDSQDLHYNIYPMSRTFKSHSPYHQEGSQPSLPSISCILDPASSSFDLHKPNQQNSSFSTYHSYLNLPPYPVTSQVYSSTDLVGYGMNHFQNNASTLNATYISESYNAPAKRVRYNSSNPAKKNNSSSKERIPKPQNCFILYSNFMRPVLQNQHPQFSNGRISQMLGEMWGNMSEGDKGEWRKEADKKKEEHRAMYPNYRCGPYRKWKRQNGNVKTEAQNRGLSASVPSSMIWGNVEPSPRYDTPAAINSAGYTSYSLQQGIPFAHPARGDHPKF